MTPGLFLSEDKYLIKSIRNTMNHNILLHGTNVGTLVIWRKRGDQLVCDHEEINQSQILPRRRFVAIAKESNNGES